MIFIARPSCLLNLTFFAPFPTKIQNPAAKKIILQDVPMNEIQKPFRVQFERLHNQTHLEEQESFQISL